jgi:hypothetical protein
MLEYALNQDEFLKNNCRLLERKKLISGLENFLFLIPKSGCSTGLD